MAAITDPFLRAQLEQRRQKLEAAMANSSAGEPLAQLLREVDSALERMQNGTYGLCQTCHESIEAERLIANPLVRYCLDHLTAEQQRALERDLELAGRIQAALLPKRQVRRDGWEVHYHYEPAGPVSGDYCDLIDTENAAGDLFFLLGDVSGKGVAASMLMSHLHAMFRSLTTVGLPVDELVGRANRVFCESTIAGQFATLICGRAGRSGEVEICNAGHCPVLAVSKSGVSSIDATGVPLGMFCDSLYAVRKTRLAPGDTLFLYTDGVSEAQDGSCAEYGLRRLSQFVGERHALGPQALAAACLEDLRRFSAGAAQTDDLTILVIRRAAGAMVAAS